MARPTLFSHPKWAKLVARLKNRALALGSLELIWEAAYASGDPVIGDVEAVEELADWRGQRGELAAAMVHAGFLDLEQAAANGGHVHVVHDLEDHAPDYVIKRWEREAKRKAEGKTIREVRQDAARSRWKQRAMQMSAAVLPPAPAPNTDPDRSRADLQAAANGEQMQTPGVWSPWRWKELFGRVWARLKNKLTYAMANDSVACSKLADVLEQLTLEERLEAEAKAPAMFEAFMADDYAPLVKAQHPFAWFVQRFGALLVEIPAPGQSPASTAGVKQAIDSVLAPIGSASEARRAAAALRSQPRAEAARAPARTEVTVPPSDASGAS